MGDGLKNDRMRMWNYSTLMSVLHQYDAFSIRNLIALEKCNQIQPSILTVPESEAVQHKPVILLLYPRRISSAVLKVKRLNGLPFSAQRFKHKSRLTTAANLCI